MAATPQEVVIRVRIEVDQPETPAEPPAARSPKWLACDMLHHAAEHWKSIPEDERPTLVNDMLAGTNGETFGFMRPVGEMDRDTAVRAACWLLALTDPMCDQWPVILAAVMDT